MWYFAGKLRGLAIIGVGVGAVALFTGDRSLFPWEFLLGGALLWAFADWLARQPPTVSRTPPQGHSTKGSPSRLVQDLARGSPPRPQDIEAYAAKRSEFYIPDSELDAKIAELRGTLARMKAQLDTTRDPIEASDLALRTTLGKQGLLDLEARQGAIAARPQPAASQPLGAPPRTPIAQSVGTPPRERAADITGEASQGKIRVLIVDDFKEVRDRLIAFIEEAGDMSVVGEARTGEEAVQMFRALKPDVVSTNINMPGLDGIDATRLMCSDESGARVVIVSVQSEGDCVRRAMAAGAMDFLAKPVGREEYLVTLRNAARAEPRTLTGFSTPRASPPPG